MPVTYPMRFHNVVVQDNWSVGTSSFNELRLGFNRVNLDRHPLGIENLPAWISISSINASQSSSIHFLSTTYTLADNFTSIHGAHSLKMGFEIREVRSVRDQGGIPTYTYNSYADAIANKPLTVGLLFGGGKGLRTRNMGFYVQDDWRARRNLQVSIGLRYEYTPPLRGGFNIQGSDPYGPFIKAQEPMYRADRNDWAPRIGMVWTPSFAQGLVVRAGGALSYLMPQAIHFYDMAYIDPRLPFVATVNSTDVPAQYLLYPNISPFQTQVQQNPGLLPSNFRLSRSVADYNRRDTYIGMWNFSLQQSVARNTAVQASYVGTRTVKLISVRPLNLIDPVTKVRPAPELGQINFEENAANIAYHSLQLSLNQRPWHGLRYDGYFTWAKSIGYYNPDDTITFTGGSLQDPDNIAGSKGRVRGIPGKRYTSTISYALPRGTRIQNRVLHAALSGWTLRAINSWREGLPINVTAGTDVVGNGRSAGQRPDPVAGVDPYIREGLIWLNPAAFTTAGVRAQKRFGYLGFNAVTGTPAFTLNTALHKTFVLREQHRVTFRLETFNTLNHPLLSNPTTNANDPNFGKILQASGARNVQLALKYTF
jgi:hypothetical protein